MMKRGEWPTLDFVLTNAPDGVAHHIDALAAQLAEAERERDALREQIAGFPNLTMMREAMIATADENKALRELLLDLETGNPVHPDATITVKVSDHMKLINDLASLRELLSTIHSEIGSTVTMGPGLRRALSQAVAAMERQP